MHMHIKFLVVHARFRLAEESGSFIEAASFFYVKVCDANAYGIPRRACQVLVGRRERGFH
jgi:hypothetical protein